ncbi:MAG: bifunctional DNA-binding transcriptional regulator/O6-methylguanine-DNA methyltransferase Ada [Alphaproteobacteria bacterium]|nr:bifunctional DNA-binding transcriptional regulator/O6-methylguanine-DNA methyltransferase Ada [Alphaproteobacteria bacterium]
MRDDPRWQAVARRDADADGQFVYAVKTTGVFCRPSCASRRPKPENVVFFAGPAAAQAAGFRACRRCKPEASAANPMAEIARQVCRLIDRALDDGAERAPTLAQLARMVKVSPYQLQRGFKRVMGISPADYGDAGRLQRLKRHLKAGEDVTDALHAAGYGAASRLYERAPAELGMTPGTYAKGGSGQRLGYALADSAFGRVLVAASQRGVAFLGLGEDDAKLLTELRRDLPRADLSEDRAVLGQWLTAVLDYLGGATPHLSLPLDVRATAFQRRVWDELRRIPAGETRTYTQLATAVAGNPKARRAVARACATNPVSLAIPCHRVLREDGGLGGYRWGLERKRRLIQQEAALSRPAAAE